jgi:hypothetical protein
MLTILRYSIRKQSVYFKYYFYLRGINVSCNAPVTIIASVCQQNKKNLYLWDFDGYDNIEQGRTLKEVLNNPDQSMGHVFVLKMRLLYGENFEIIDLDVSKERVVLSKDEKLNTQLKLAL